MWMLVLIKDEIIPVSHMRICRKTQLYPGRDNTVCVANVRTARAF